jgi:ATP-dependent helicase/nuclease subunit B
MNPALRVHSIPSDTPFLRALAAWVLTHYKHSLLETRVLLPNRRACRAFQEVLLDVSGGKPMLLPRIQPIGDWDTDDLPHDVFSGSDIGAIPPPIDSERRRFLLARLVMQFEHSRKQSSAPSYFPLQALEQAQTLARFLDDMAREGVEASALSALDLPESAVHWQEVLEFLQIISVHWPKALAVEEVIDTVDHRNRALAEITKAWENHPPEYPVIAAGSTGTQPATARLLAAIARLPQGAVIVPGLDQAMSEEEWELVAPTHPQYALKNLLKQIGVPRWDVQPLVPSSAHPDRLKMVRVVFQPAEITAGWAKTSPLLARGIKDIKLLEAETIADEARMVAVALREALENPGKTAALVTPDRRLAREVSAQLMRFGVEVDDSAGTPLLQTPPGAFLRLSMEMAVSGASPVSLLALLRHPLAALGKEAKECRGLADILDRHYLRGVRPASGLQALRTTMRAEHHAFASWLGVLEEKLRPLSVWVAGKQKIAPEVLFKEHMALAQWLASTPEQSGAARLWSDDDGAQLADALARMVPHMGLLPPIPAEYYPGFFTALLSEAVYRPRYGKHPRLSILSPIEARLLTFDRVVLGGLNEEVWPARPPVDPWMSRPMRAMFGLSPAERVIGQSAHDFFQLVASAPEVILTRAVKVDGKPTVASRWLVRMRTLLQAKDENAYAQLVAGDYFSYALHCLDAPESLAAIERPAPKPPAAARPRRMNVTEIDKWQDDPYRIYAKFVLKLMRLRPIDQDPGAADFGTIAHKAICCFSQRWPRDLPKDVEAELLAAGRSAFEEFSHLPAVEALWWPRFEAMASWLAAKEKERRGGDVEVLAERSGILPLTVDDEPFQLTTRIDRVEIDRAGNAVIVDYKTGGVPSKKALESGRAQQLSLEGLVASQGVLDPPLARKVTISGLEYWKLSAREDKADIVAVSGEAFVASLIERAGADIAALIRHYRNPETPFLAPYHAPLYDDYEHLVRRQEWGED